MTLIIRGKEGRDSEPSLGEGGFMKLRGEKIELLLTSLGIAWTTANGCFPCRCSGAGPCRVHPSSSHTTQSPAPTASTARSPASSPAVVVPTPPAPSPPDPPLPPPPPPDPPPAAVVVPIVQPLHPWRRCRRPSRRPSSRGVAI